MNEYSYQKLDVWKKAMEFASDILSISNNMPENSGNIPLTRELETSAMTVPAAIAQGRAYMSKEDFVRHLYQSKGSINKTMTLLEILRRKQAVSNGRFSDLDEAAQRVAGMLGGLIKSLNNPKPVNGDHQRQKR